MRTDKIVLGVIGGIAAGALLGVLFAPEKGKETRRKILSKSNDFAEELKDKYDTLLESITHNVKKLG
ncbi:YtxH domain-containing protein [Flavobacterium maritimum]|uniref:YtxH domain-containing protein n=1 Tax=Flavobacterium maritimum TaxID=3149042 RepID=UPI0032B4790E